MQQSDSVTSPFQHVNDPLQPSWVVMMNQLGQDRIPFLFILDFKLRSPIVIPLHEMNDQIKFQVKANDDVGILENKITLEKNPIPFDVYKAGFEKVIKAIKAGDTYLLNLCYTTLVNGITDLEEIFLQSKAPYKLLIKNQFVVFSPESFVSISDGVIRTFPMKGTIDASIPNAEELLLKNVKEQEEHATVVDLLRNDLSIVSKKVTVERYRYISKIVSAEKTLLQCSSEISGQLPKDNLDHLGTIFHSILPAGSVTGAPKKRTVELIEEIEMEPRDYYTGVFGVFDGANVDSAVMIRMIEKRDIGYYYRSGGGITYQSIAEEEYQEMIDKVYIPK